VADNLSPRSAFTSTDHVFGYVGERHLGRDLDEGQLVAPAGVNQVVGHRAQQSVPRRECGRARIVQGLDEDLAVPRGPAPDQPADDQLTTGEVLAGPEQVRGPDPPQLTVERARGLDQQPQA